AGAEGVLHGSRRRRRGQVPAVGRQEMEHRHRLDRVRPVDRAADDRGVGGEVRQGEGHHSKGLQQGRLGLLSVNNIEVIYDHVILVLKGVSLSVPEGKIVALLGANGAGKTTTLKAVSSLLRAERGEVTKGTIEFRGSRVDHLSPDGMVKLGVV